MGRAGRWRCLRRTVRTRSRAGNHRQPADSAELHRHPVKAGHRFRYRHLRYTVTPLRCGAQGDGIDIARLEHIRAPGDLSPAGLTFTANGSGTCGQSAPRWPCHRVRNWRGWTNRWGDRTDAPIPSITTWSMTSPAAWNGAELDAAGPDRSAQRFRRRRPNSIFPASISAPSSSSRTLTGSMANRRCRAPQPARTPGAP